MPFNIVLDPVSWYESWKQAAQFERWCKLIFSLSFSFVIGFAIGCGSALIARQSGLVSVGYGLIAAGTSATVVFRRSELTKGLTVALPQSEAEQELSGNSPIQVITKN